MNTPLLRTLGQKDGKTVYLLGEQHVTLGFGFNPTTLSLGMNDKGQPIFAPNRRQRRSGFQKANRRRAFGYQKQHQPILSAGKVKFITHAIIAKQTSHGGINI